MKRRSFILLSATGITALVIPSLSCTSVSPGSVKILQLPNQLSHICDAQTIRDIGNAYRKQVAAEANKDQLIKLLLTDNSGNSISKSSDTTALKTILGDKVKEDFEKGNVVEVKGWVLSKTEARQCAVFSFSQP
ncbi:MAG: hypothetical protein JST75_06790 [Bacteroidetes bacterium]|nr:hypothetical protein [Bacteroidota bacterium]